MVRKRNVPGPRFVNLSEFVTSTELDSDTDYYQDFRTLMEKRYPRRAVSQPSYVDAGGRQILVLAGNRSNGGFP